MILMYYTVIGTPTMISDVDIKTGKEDENSGGGGGVGGTKN